MSQQPLDQECPYCKVSPGHPCKTRSWGLPITGYHAARIKAAARSRPSRDAPVPDLNIRPREGARPMPSTDDEEIMSTTWKGGHALVIEYGDCEFIGRCQCGEPFATIRPDQPLDTFGRPWETHVMTEVNR